VLIASPGCVLLRRDYSGIEARITGYLAADELIEKLATLGIHSWTTAKALEIPIPPLDSPGIIPFLEKIKKDHPRLYKKNKTTLYMIFFGAGPKRIWEENTDVFENYTEAFRTRKQMFEFFPNLKRWQITVQGQTRSSHYVRIPFGNNRWLWAIPGSDSTKCIAQWPQGMAAGVIKRAMIRIDDDPFIEPYLMQQVHDEVALDVPKDIWEEADEHLVTAMEYPVEELGGMTIATSRKVGETL